MSYEGYKWYKGVPHSHTVASDGGLTLEELIVKEREILESSSQKYVCKCFNCGTEFDEIVRFCIKCGTKID